MNDPIDAVINIDKPVGHTSMDVVRRVKRLVGQKQVGHGGTLDPQSSGVLPVCLGYASRLMEFVLDSSKEYQGTIKMGVSTDTYDAEGKVLSNCDSSFVTEKSLELVLSELRGKIQQTPPMFSALKHAGQRLYELARQGIEVDRPARQVEIFRLDLTEWKPPFVTIHVECGRGAYIRSLAHDIGQLLGCGAHLVALRRLKTGPFRIEDAVSVDRFEELFRSGLGDSVLYPPDYLLLHLRAIITSSQEEIRLRNGQEIQLEPTTHHAEHLEQCRAYSSDGRLIALVRFDRPLLVWKPFKVFRSRLRSPYAEHEVFTLR